LLAKKKSFIGSATGSNNLGGEGSCTEFDFFPENSFYIALERLCVPFNKLLEVLASCESEMR